MVKQKKPLKMRDFLARVGSLRILYRYPCPHFTKLFLFVKQYVVCQLLSSILFWQLIVLDVDSIQNFLFCAFFICAMVAASRIFYFASFFSFLNISPANSAPSRLIEILTSPSTVFSIKVPVVNAFL